MKRLIVNADDFGLTEGVNEGIIKAFKEGILTSTTVMVNQPFLEHAYKLWKENRGLGLGLHLTFDKGKALGGISSLTDKKGNLLNLTELSIVGKEEDFYREILAQLEKYREIFGSDPTHFDSHHHIHIRNPQAQKAIERASKRTGIRYRKSENLIGSFFAERVTIEDLMELLNSKADEELEYAELMTHPGIADEELLKVSSYNKTRELELGILTSQQMMNFIKERFQLISFADL